MNGTVGMTLDNESDIVKTEIRIVRKLRMLPQSVEYFLRGVVFHDRAREILPNVTLQSVGC